MPTGFLTDSTLCIGCKACEVACKEWNELPGDGFAWSGLSYDNTVALGATTWRHVLFVEHDPTPGCGGNAGEPSWHFLSDVCKHCEHAGCLEACPTGALVRTETGAVYLQSDVCNGCGYCVVSCPFGVVERRESDGRAWKCTFCYDRQRAGLVPACAKACPTESIRFGELDELRDAAVERVTRLHEQGIADAQIYDPRDTSVGGVHALFVLRGEPEEYNLPRRPEAPTRLLPQAWGAAAGAAAALVAGAFAAFLVGRER